MRIANIYTAVVGLAAFVAIAGDDSSGPIKYKVDLGASFTTYELSEKDKSWAQRLAKKFEYSGKISYFVRTSIPLEVDGETVKGGVYQRLDEPACFYVAPADYMLKVGTLWPANPGVGGLSLNAPASKNLIACMNCHCGGVPALSSTPVIKGAVSWSGYGHKRI